MNQAGCGATLRPSLEYRQESLEPLIALYPECPLGPIFAPTPAAAPENALRRMTSLVSSLFHRADRDPMMVQATVVWLAFDAGALKVRKGLSLAQLPEIEHYPDTELSKRVGGAIRSSRTCSSARNSSTRLHPSQSGRYPDLTARARIHADTALAAKYCREAVDMLVSAHGTSSLADSNRMQRLWRDAHVASHHAITEWQVNLEIYGKALLGVEPNITPLI